MPWYRRRRDGGVDRKKKKKHSIERKHGSVSERERKERGKKGGGVFMRRERPSRTKAVGPPNFRLTFRGACKESGI